MAASTRRLVLLLSFLALALPAGGAAPGDVDTRRFPRLARILLLPEEVAVLKDLRDDKDRLEFQKIFWARRDPTPGTPANEFKDNVLAVWARADELFSYPSQKGSETGCGQVLALLGRPEEVLAKGKARKEPETGDTARSGSNLAASNAPGSGRQYDSMAYLREGSTREPETWVYRDRPGLPYGFTGAELKVEFDSECRYAEGAGFLGQDLRKAAAAFVTRPDLSYALGPGGHLVPLAAAASASTGASAGARALLASPRSDFPLEVEPKLALRAPKGEAYLAGLVSARPPAAGGALGLSLVAQAADASGQAVASAGREATAAPQADGTVVASWGLALPPGRYKLTVAASLPDGKGSVAGVDLDVPDLGGAALATSPLVLYPDEPAAGRADPRDPFGAFRMGSLLLHPRYRNAFTAKDGLRVVAAVYGAKLDPATGQAALKARYSILKDGRPVARGAEETFTTADAVASVGPIPLAGYAPGAYVVRLDVTDIVSKQTLRHEAPLEIQP
jgi:GWxTD domain-containing protein